MKVDIRLGRMLYCATPPATNNNSGKMFPKINSWQQKVPSVEIYMRMPHYPCSDPQLGYFLVYNLQSSTIAKVSTVASRASQKIMSSSPLLISV